MCKVGERARLAKEEWWCYMPVARFSEISDAWLLASEETWDQQTVQEPVMGGAVDSSNGGSQPVHLTNRTSNANKQPPIAGAISFAEAKATLPRLPFVCSYTLLPLPSTLFLWKLRVSVTLLPALNFAVFNLQLRFRSRLFCNVNSKNIMWLQKKIILIAIRTRFE